VASVVAAAVTAVVTGDSLQYCSAGGDSDSGEGLRASSSPPDRRHTALVVVVLSIALRSGVGEPHAAHAIGIEASAPNATDGGGGGELSAAALAPSVLMASGGAGVPTIGARGPRNW